MSILPTTFINLYARVKLQLECKVNMESFHGRGFVFLILVLCMEYGYHDKSEVMFCIDKFCDCCVLEHYHYLFKMNS